MELKRWNGFCLCGLGGVFPPEAAPTETLFSPLVLLVDRPPERSRGCFAVHSIDEALEPEGVCALQPAVRTTAPESLRAAVDRWGATVLNTAFSRAFSYLAAPRKTDGLRLTLPRPLLLRHRAEHRERLVIFPHRLVSAGKVTLHREAHVPAQALRLG